MPGALSLCLPLPLAASRACSHPALLKLVLPTPAPALTRQPQSPSNPGTELLYYRKRQRNAEYLTKSTRIRLKEEGVQLCPAVLILKTIHFFSGQEECRVPN
jgi:hypothetical protein